MVTDARIAEYESVVAGVRKWAESQANIVAVGVVGSWASGNQHDDSDLDFVVLTPQKTSYTASDGWIEDAVGQSVPVVRRAEWGVLTERRLKLPSGLEIEVGFVEPSWAATDPTNPGTAEVVGDGGLLPVYDPDGVLKRFAAATT
jgi:predicted nucleotidyltransferase